MDTLFTEWEEHYKKAGLDPTKLCKDGIICDELYQKASKKILCVLKETNGAPNNEMDMRVGIRKGYRGWLTLARWVAGILYDFPPYQQIASDYEFLRKAIYSVAFINIKKYEGGPSSDPIELNAFAYFDREFLRRQIEIINPEYILACEEPVYEILIWLLGPDGSPFDIYKHQIGKYVFKNRFVINWKHPSRKNSEETYKELAKLFK